MSRKTGIHVGYLHFYDGVINYCINNQLIPHKPSIDFSSVGFPIHRHIKELTTLLSVEESQHNHKIVKEMTEYVDEIIVKNIEAVPREVLRSSTRIHLIDNNVTTQGGLSDATINKIEELHEQQQMDKKILREHKGGRPPLGTTVEGGYLVKSEKYETVRRMLKRYREDNVSMEGAAKALDTSQKTISNAAKRTGLYQLE